MGRARKPVRAPVERALWLGEQLKGVAAAAGLSLSGASKWAHYLGYKKQWLTETEWRDVLDARARKGMTT